MIDVSTVAMLGANVAIMTEVGKRLWADRPAAAPYIAVISTLFVVAIWTVSQPRLVERTDLMDIMSLAFTVLAEAMGIYHGTKLAAKALANGKG